MDRKRLTEQVGSLVNLTSLTIETFVDATPPERTPEDLVLFLRSSLRVIHSQALEIFLNVRVPGKRGRRPDPKRERALALLKGISGLPSLDSDLGSVSPETLRKAAQETALTFPSTRPYLERFCQEESEADPLVLKRDAPDRFRERRLKQTRTRSALHRLRRSKKKKPPEL